MKPHARHQRLQANAQTKRLEVASKPKLCRKKAFTKQTAKRVLKIERARGVDGGLETYRCGYCTTWHLGHPTAHDKAHQRGLHHEGAIA